MRWIMRCLTAVCSLLLLVQPALAQEPVQSSEAARQAIMQALQSDIRPAADKARDDERQPSTSEPGRDSRRC
mgnify:CR=1 FL=1